MGVVFRMLLASLLAVSLGTVISAGGCYSPSVSSCQYTCGAPPIACPQGLVCNGEHMCVEKLGESCRIGPDAAMDVMIIMDTPKDAKPDSMIPDGGSMPGG